MPIALLLFATQARAQPGSPSASSIGNGAVVLTWQAPPGCPSQADVSAEIANMLSTTRARADVPPVRVRASVRARGARFELRLWTEQAGQSGQRLLQTPDCAALPRTVSLLLGLMLGRADGDEIDRTLPEASHAEASSAASNSAETSNAEPSNAEPRNAEPSDESEATPPPASTAAQASVDAQASREAATAAAIGWALHAGGGAQAAALPRLGWVGTLGADILFSPVRVSLLALAWPTAHGPAHRDVESARARVSGLGLAALACRDTPIAPLSLSLCAGGQLAWLRARADGDQIVPSSAVAPWPGLRAAVELTWPHDSPLRLRLSLDGVLSLGRPRFIIDGLPTLHRVPILAPSARLSLVLPGT